jgi:hypothetical protein
MKNKLTILFCTSLVLATLVISCTGPNNNEKTEISDVEKWKLGWRLINSSLDKNFVLGEQQLDSLLNRSGNMDVKFLITGFEVLAELGKKEKIIDILGKQNQSTLEEICNKDLFTQKLTDIQLCKSMAKVEKVKNKELQIELIKMYLNDQYVRSNLMTDLLEKYNLSKKDVIIDSFGVSTDERNRGRLKEIIGEFGFPTRRLVGKDAMEGIFMMIQHSDGDKEWQKQQLTQIEKAVKQGDMDGQSYAYLYDRIKINGGEKQLYGTQFKNVDLINKTVDLSDTEDIENLDRRRMEVGMMPIQMYEQIMLRNLPK